MSISRRTAIFQSLGALGAAATPLAARAIVPAQPRASARPDLPPPRAAAHVLNRLGFGPRPGDLTAVGRDPLGWIDAQLAPAALALPRSLIMRLRESQITDADPIAVLRDYAQIINETQRARAEAASAAGGTAGAQVAAEPTEMAPRPPERMLSYLRQYQLPALESRIFRALESPRQLEEVMVDFWFNHFNVFQGKNLLRVMMGHYEHHAIRPHAMGRFRDLLGATAHHPAMLYYLDNWTSVAERSAGPGRGLNENYARELMELHTLGADAGYTQADVTQLARMLTGWTMLPLRPRGPYAQMQTSTAQAQGRAGEMPGFWFNERVHDRGDKTWLGQRITAQGKAEGDFALDLLAAHPATARRIAYKLAQYFVSDKPEPALVARLAEVFIAQDGQIVPVLRALFASEDFWSPRNVGVKFKTPYQFTLSVLRATGESPANILPLAGHLAAQGMPLFGCPTPDGYKNTEEAWLNPDGMTKRINFASQIANGRLGNESLRRRPDADQLMARLGPLVHASTRSALEQYRHEPSLAAALVLAGPGMMRR